MVSVYLSAKTENVITTNTAFSASIEDVHLKLDDGSHFSAKIFYKDDDFDFKIISLYKYLFLFLFSPTQASRAYAVYISHLRYVTTSMSDFLRS